MRININVWYGQTGKDRANYNHVVIISPAGMETSVKYGDACIWYGILKFLQLCLYTSLA